jgi:hypothetical protein
MLAQSRQPEEIVVIDDASTDNSVAVIEQYAAQHARIRLIHLAANEGVVRAVNRGLAEAKGTHVLFAAADDWLLPGMIAQSMELLERWPAAGLCSGVSLVTDDSDATPRPLRTRVVRRKPGYIAPREVSALLDQDEAWFMGNTLILNRAAVVAAGGFRAELMSYCDMFLYQVLALTHGACFVPAPLAVWRRLSTGYSGASFADPERMLAILAATKALMTGVFANSFTPTHIAGFERRFRYWAASGVVAAAPGQTQRFLRALPRPRVNDERAVAMMLRLPIAGRTLVKLYFFARVRWRDTLPVLRRHLFWIVFGHALTRLAAGNPRRSDPAPAKAAAHPCRGDKHGSLPLARAGDGPRPSP